MSADAKSGDFLEDAYVPGRTVPSSQHPQCRA